jgi:hypothetical protein
MFKSLPEFENIAVKSTSFMVDTMEFQKSVYIKSLEYFNQITDRMFYTYTEKASETIEAATEYAKENIKQQKVANLFGSGK